MVPEISIGVQDVPVDARNNFSFGVSFRKCHLTHQDATCPPSLALDPWRTGRVLERSLGVPVQEVHMDAKNNFSFSVSYRICHLTYQDATCPPFLALNPWWTGRVLERSLGVPVQDIHIYGCQKQLLFWCLLQKMPFNPSRCHLSSISGVGSLEDRNGSRQESAF